MTAPECTITPPFIPLLAQKLLETMEFPKVSAKFRPKRDSAVRNLQYSLLPLLRAGALTLFLFEASLIASTSSTENAGQESFNPDDWYQRYPVYPPYCSTPAEMARRAIPPLRTDNSGIGNPDSLQLVQVTAVLRHGARTPYSGQISCWENYTQADTGVWNCNLTTLMAPPSPKSIAEEEDRPPPAGRNVSASMVQFLFEKRYDALQDVPENLSNDLRGTCQLGQLLLQGYEQELTNGQHLRQAYIDNTNDPRMNLFRPPVGEELPSSWPWDDLYYRADDDQRTLMSGQVVLRGLLGPDLQRYYDAQRKAPVASVVIPLHTADRDRDVMDANEGVCPQLAAIHSMWQNSAEYQQYTNSQEAQTLQRFVREVLRVDHMNGVDCLMTTICTDRSLPNALNDYTGPPKENDKRDPYQVSQQHPYGTNLFQRLFDFDAQNWIKLFQFQDAAYSKLALTPLWRDILANVQGMLDRTRNSSTVVCCPPRAPPGIAIYSGHDTTLMPLLASLGGSVYDGSWAPYASMLNLELYQQTRESQSDPMNDKDFWFRLVYNGEVLTPLLDGCNKAELCRVDVLLQRVRSFTRDYNCHNSVVTANPTTSSGNESIDVFSSPGGIAAVCLLILGSALFGSLSTYLYVVDRTRRRGDRQRLSQTDLDEDGISMQFHQESKEQEATISRSATFS